MDAYSIMKTIVTKKLFFATLMFTLCCETFAQEKKSSYVNFSVGAGWNNKTLLMDGEVFGGKMNGFYTNLGIDFTIKHLPLGLGMSLGFQADYYSYQTKVQQETIKQKHSLYLLPAEIHLFYLVSIPKTAIKIYPFVGIGKEIALSWKIKEQSTITTQYQTIIEKTPKKFQLLKGTLPIIDLTGAPIININTMPKEDNAPFYWHVGARLDLTPLIGLKYSYQHNIGSKNYFNNGTFYQHSVGILFHFDIK